MIRVTARLTRAPGRRPAPRRARIATQLAQAGCRPASGRRSTSADASSRACSDEVLVAQQRAAAAAGERPPLCARAEHVALAALLEVEPGQLEAVGRRGDGVEPLPRRGPGSASVTSRHSPGSRAAADPAAQLVQLGDAEPVGVHDHHDRGVGDVDADLDDGRRDEHVDLAGGEGAHHARPCRRAPSGRAAPRPAARPGTARRAARSTTSTTLRSSRGARPPRRRRPALRGSPSSSVGGVPSTRRTALAGLAARRRRCAGTRRRPGAPARPPRATRSQVRSTQRGLDAPARRASRSATGRAGSSVSVEVSRSPNTVIATVRGIGVAVMTSTCGGWLALARASASRCSTPNRCCSSTTTSPRSAN